MKVYTLQIVCPKCKQAVCVVVGDKEVMCDRLHMVGWGVQNLSLPTQEVWICPRCISHPRP